MQLSTEKWRKQKLSFKQYLVVAGRIKLNLEILVRERSYEAVA